MIFVLNFERFEFLCYKAANFGEPKISFIIPFILLFRDNFIVFIGKKLVKNRTNLNANNMTIV